LSLCSLPACDAPARGRRRPLTVDVVSSRCLPRLPRSTQQRLPAVRSKSPTLGSTVLARDLGDEANVVYCTARLGSKREDVPSAVVVNSALRSQVPSHPRTPSHITSLVFSVVPFFLGLSFRRCLPSVLSHPSLSHSSPSLTFTHTCNAHPPERARLVGETFFLASLLLSTAVISSHLSCSDHVSHRCSLGGLCCCRSSPATRSPIASTTRCVTPTSAATLTRRPRRVRTSWTWGSSQKTAVCSLLQQSCGKVSR
jgi:hypothetical protein